LGRIAAIFPEPEMQNTTAIHPDTTMRELLEIFPGAQRALFKKYHIGGCASCGFRPEETLAQVCERNEQLPVDEVIEHIQSSHEEDLKMQIAPAELAEKLNAGNGDVRLVDIRTREEFEAARIEGAALFTQELMQEMLAKWDRAGLVVFVDHEGKRSMDAAAYFAGHGFANAKSLRGGVDAWSQEVDPDVPRYHLE
jgi:rhodanese-related sulfurtransferase